MTLREACDAGDNREPVLYNGIRYRRITRAGYCFPPNGGPRIPIVELEDWGENSTVVCPVGQVELEYPEKDVEVVLDDESR